MGRAVEETGQGYARSTMITDPDRKESSCTCSGEFQTIRRPPHVIVARFDRKLRYLFVNSSGIHSTGKGPEEFLGKPIEELGMPPQLCALWSSTLREVFERGERRNVQCSFPANGGRVCYTVEAAPEFGPGGEVESVLSITRDETDGAGVDGSSHDREERLRLALRITNQGIWDWDVTTDILTCDRRCEEILGHSVAPSASFQRCLENLHPDDRERVAHAATTAIRSRRDLVAEFRILRPDGSLRWVQVSGRAIAKERNNADRMVGTILDITERKEAEKDLQGSLAQLQTVLDTMEEGLLVADSQGNILQANPALLSIVGLKDLPRENLREYAKRLEARDPEGRPVSIEELPLSRALRGETVRGVEHHIKRLDTGREYVGIYSAAPIFDTEGRVLLAVVTLHDITDRKRQEEILRQTKEELEIRVQERTGELERSNKALQEFASIASHDLQEPLRKIQAFGDALVEKFYDSFNEEARDYIGRMQNAAERMQVLLHSLLAYSRVTTKPDPFVQVDLAESVGEALSNLEIRLEETKGTVTVGELPVIEGDPSQIVQLFQNLVGNALKFHGKGESPRVKISSEWVLGGRFKGGAYRIRVEDNGIGMEEKHLKRIFMPFDRLHGKSEYGGVGMGLAICQRIVERHGGNIKVKSAPGKGSTFTVTLPVKQRNPAHRSR
jgi:PAS domain S-box-containing protein